MTGSTGVDDVASTLRQHLSEYWSDRAKPKLVTPGGAIKRSLAGFEVLAFPPAGRDAWVYVSIGAWRAPTQGAARFEFLITSPVEDQVHCETLAMVAHFHADPRYQVHLGKILEIGRPWMESSTCDHLLISLPYPFGPRLEICRVHATEVRFLWLLPITAREAAFARTHGVDALEDLFERERIDTLDVNRRSVVE